MLVNLSNLLALSTTATLVEDPSWQQALTGKTCGKEKWKVDKLKEGDQEEQNGRKFVERGESRCHPCPHFAVTAL